MYVIVHIMFKRDRRMSSVYSRLTIALYPHHSQLACVLYYICKLKLIWNHNIRGSVIFIFVILDTANGFEIHSNCVIWWPISGNH